MSNESNRDKLNEILRSDPFNLLDMGSSAQSKSKTEEQRLVESFAEVSSFFEEHDREPDSERDLGEHILKSRLDAMRSDPKKVKALLPYDFYGLLHSESAKAISLEDILQDDPLDLLGTEGSDETVFVLDHVSRSDRIRPEHISRRHKCKDFAQYEEVFERIHRELREGRRKLVECKAMDVVEGKLFVLRGVLLYLEKDSSTWQEKQYSTGNYNRLDGRTRCIFDNGTESSILLRSLNKALHIDGFGISEVLGSEEDRTAIEDSDVQNGFIYVVRSLSHTPEIAGTSNLHKIGFSSSDVTYRIRNAVNEPTYLMSDVEVILTVRCFNMNVRYLETSVHEFFSDVTVSFEVTDKEGGIHCPHEWCVAPLPIIEEAIRLIVEGRVGKYKYEPSLKTIILREGQCP